MAKIRLLSTKEIKLIAAGEVVESPASIVKELIENAFDAQSTKISLSIEEGGTKLIKVSDNGSGIDQPDLALALLPHATSKLDSFCNAHIKNNNCYGFRGEALAAISGVAELTLESRTLNSHHGYSISSKEGKTTDTVPCGTNYGTTITIKNLFESIPARKKYLPSKLTLEKNILYAFQGLALGKPAIEMTFIKEHKIIYSLQKRKSFISRATDFLSQPLNRYTEIMHKDEYCSIAGLLSFVVPLNQKEKVPNYVAYSFFEDHYGVRLGSQFSYAINRYYKVVLYGSWQHNFPKTEMIPAVFENQTAFGLNPLYLKGKTSWNELFFAADLVISYNKTSGGYLGYEFFKKTNDKITPQLTEFQTVNGEVYPLNYTAWEKFTDSVANILICSLYTAYKQVNLSIEYKGVITGKNIMNMQEINCKVGYEF